MKREHEEKLELAKKLLKEESEGYMKGVFWDGLKIMEGLVATKNTEVLCGLFDLFTEENENGVCETLYNGILDNFTVDQIIEVLYTKFSELVVNNEMRAIYFADYCLNCDCFDKFRSMFNNAKSPNSEKFLDEFEDTYGEDYPEEISILREDMKNW